MRVMVKRGLFIVAGAVALLMAYTATRPDSFRVERSAVVQAPPERVHPLVADMHAFNGWNPYARKDPAIAMTYAGPASGVGAASSWVSKEVGSGRMEITESRVPNTVAMKLDFIEPFEAHNNVVFTIRPEGSASHVTWAMEGPVPFVAKLMHLFFNVDKMVGQDFEAGLANLKATAESR